MLNTFHSEIIKNNILGISSSLVSEESDGTVSGSLLVSSSDVSDESGCVELARSTETTEKNIGWIHKSQTFLIFQNVAMLSVPRFF